MKFLPTRLYIIHNFATGMKDEVQNFQEMNIVSSIMPVVAHAL